MAATAYGNSRFVNTALIDGLEQSDHWGRLKDGRNITSRRRGRCRCRSCGTIRSISGSWWLRSRSCFLTRITDICPFLGIIRFCLVFLVCLRYGWRRISWFHNLGFSRISWVLGRDCWRYLWGTHSFLTFCVFRSIFIVVLCCWPWWRWCWGCCVWRIRGGRRVCSCRCSRARWVRSCFRILSICLDFCGCGRCGVCLRPCSTLHYKCIPSVVRSRRCVWIFVTFVVVSICWS